MVGSERTKMAAGEWYSCLDPELEALRVIARDAVFEHNSMPPRQRGDIGPALHALLGSAGAGARIEAPFHCAYGFNIFLGEGVFLNAGCTILDTAMVRIGKGTLLRPQRADLLRRASQGRGWAAERAWRSPGRSRSATTHGSAAAPSSLAA